MVDKSSSGTDTELPLGPGDFEYLTAQNSLSWSDSAPMESLLCAEEELELPKVSKYYERAESLDTLVTKLTSSEKEAMNVLLTAVDPCPPPQVLPYRGRLETGGHLPCNEDWAGPLDFSLSFPPADKNPLPKSASWTFSEELNKLYIDLNKSCPVRVHLGKPVPRGLMLRALPIYSHPCHISSPVQRCPNHRDATHETNKDFRHLKHVVRLDDPRAKYEEVTDGRFSVIIPLQAPDPGVDFNTVLTRFVCLSSCIGGINRRAIQLVFTIEYYGHVVGRRVLNIRICACPGRDCRLEEKRLLDSKHDNTALEGSSAPKRQKLQYTIVVEQKDVYDILNNMKNLLEKFCSRRQRESDSTGDDGSKRPTTSTVKQECD